MDNWSLDYDKHRLDNILLYYKFRNEYILTTMCVYTGIDKYMYIYKGPNCPLVYSSYMNHYFVHPITNKRHTALYSTGTDIIDGYGTLYPNLKFEYDKIIGCEIAIKVYTRPLHDPGKWQDNIEKKNPSNVYGEIPTSTNVTISNDTNQLAAVSFAHIYSYEELVTLYKNPSNLKKKISDNYKIYQESFI